MSYYFCHRLLTSFFCHITNFETVLLFMCNNFSWLEHDSPLLTLKVWEKPSEHKVRLLAFPGAFNRISRPSSAFIPVTFSVRYHCWTQAAVTISPSYTTITSRNPSLVMWCEGGGNWAISMATKQTIIWKPWKIFLFTLVSFGMKNI